MKTLHSSEPWRVGTPPPNGEQNIGTTDGLMVAVTTTGRGVDSKANARRIVAAINACEGISTELLEGASLLARHVKGRERLSAYTARVEAQREQLLAALEAVLANCLDAEGLSAAYANARAAIAAVKVK